MGRGRGEKRGEEKGSRESPRDSQPPKSNQTSNRDEMQIVGEREHNGTGFLSGRFERIPDSDSIEQNFNHEIINMFAHPPFIKRNFSGRKFEDVTHIWTCPRTLLDQ